MGRMFDAVNPANIPAAANGGLLMTITVLANPEGQAFDLEPGNAGAASVVSALHRRLAAGFWSVGYVNETTEAELTAAMAATGLGWSAAEKWPGPGVYLWAADPDRNIEGGRWRPPVTPLAVQDTYEGTVDISTTAPNFGAAVAGYIDGPVSEWSPAALARYVRLPSSGPAPTPPPPPPPPPPNPNPPSEVINVKLPVLAKGSKGRPVATVQTLVGGIAADGIFGPITDARVQKFQNTAGLAVDGIVGLHTWGALLGYPQ